MRKGPEAGADTSSVAPSAPASRYRLSTSRVSVNEGRMRPEGFTVSVSVMSRWMCVEGATGNSVGVSAKSPVLMARR